MKKHSATGRAGPEGNSAEVRAVGEQETVAENNIAAAKIVYAAHHDE
jgi:hypothetical protein